MQGVLRKARVKFRRAMQNVMYGKGGPEERLARRRMILEVAFQRDCYPTCSVQRSFRFIEITGVLLDTYVVWVTGLIRKRFSRRDMKMVDVVRF